MLSSIHNTGQQPYLYKDNSNQPTAINRSIINDINKSGDLPIGFSGRNHPLDNPRLTHQRIQDGENDYNRLYSKPTNSDATVFNTLRQQQYSDKHSRYPIIIPNETPGMYSSNIYNTNDVTEKINNKNNVINENMNIDIKTQPLRQKRQRFTDVDIMYESKLPVFMRNSHLNFMNLNEKSPIDKHTDKLIENSKNKLLQEDKLDENTRWNLNNNDNNWTTSHNPQTNKIKDDNTFNETFLSSSPKYYSTNERREYFNNKLRTNAGNYVNTLTSTREDSLKLMIDNSQQDNGFITDFNFNNPIMLTQDNDNNDDYFALNESEYIYLDNQQNKQQNKQNKNNNEEQTEHYTLISTTNDSINTLTNNYQIEAFDNITTGQMVYKSVLQSYSIALVNHLLTFEDFKPWNEYWQYLQKNLHKCNCTFEILKPDDKDVAYVQNKGEKMRFRIQDNKRFVPISIYTYVLCHELAHLANEHEYGHAQRFQDLMHLIELAAYELGIIKPEKYPDDNYMSNNMVILSKSSIKQELLEGIQLVVNNGANKKFYSDLANKIKSY